MSKLKLFATFVCFALVVLFSSEKSAQAILLTADDPIFGSGSVTQDTSSGLEWLDVNASIFRSYNYVSGQFGVGGEFEGWRYATTAEVTTLFTNAGFAPAHFSVPAVAEMLDLIVQLGVTHTISGTVSGENNMINGYFDDGDADLRIGYAQLFFDVRVNDSESRDLSTNRVLTNFLDPDHDTGAFGSWLVRETQTVPEPGVGMLFGLGILGLWLLRIVDKRQRLNVKVYSDFKRSGLP